MKESDLTYFRGPERFNCAQSVYRSLEKLREIEEEKSEELATAGSGRAPDGMCGALYAAKQMLPAEQKAELRSWFEQNGGSVRCREIRQARKLSCRDCVAAAADYVERNLTGAELSGRDAEKDRK